MKEQRDMGGLAALQALPRRLNAHTNILRCTDDFNDEICCGEDMIHDLRNVEDAVFRSIMKNFVEALALLNERKGDSSTAISLRQSLRKDMARCWHL
jgi:hypothetical protein